MTNHVINPNLPTDPQETEDSVSSFLETPEQPNTLTPLAAKALMLGVIAEPKKTDISNKITDKQLG